MMIKRYFSFLSLLLFFCCCAGPSGNIVPVERLYVGTFSVRGSEGIYAYDFDRTTNTFTPIGQYSGPESPSFLTIPPDGRFLYSANRQSIGADSTFGSVIAYGIDSLTGQLQQIDQSSSYGVSPCHISLDAAGSRLYLSHYAGGSLSVLKLQTDGSIGGLVDTLHHTGRGPHPERQETPHLHSIQMVPGTDYFLAADLGTDKLYFYQEEAGVIRPAPIVPIEVEAGAGPRHFTFSKDAGFVYIAEELSSSVSVYALDLQNRTTRFIQRLPTLPAGFSGQNTVADIHLSPDGRFLYVSNRGHDSLAVYELDLQEGTLQFLAHQPTGGKTPRNFLIDPQGDFVLVANQDTDELIFFQRDQDTGLLEMTDLRLAIPSPVCLQWLATVPGLRSPVPG